MYRVCMREGRKTTYGREVANYAVAREQQAFLNDLTANANWIEVYVDSNEEFEPFWVKVMNTGRNGG